MEYINILFIILIPLLSGVIGWLTNFLAIQMLFRPVKPISILGFKLWGLVPKRHVQIAERISREIAQEFFTEKDLVNWIQPEDVSDVIKHYISKKWDEKIDEILDASPMIKMFVNSESLGGLRDKAAELFSKDPQNLIEHIQKIAQSKLNVQQIVEKNILEFDLERLEKMVKNIAKNEIVLIQRLGAIIGFLIGIIQTVIFVVFS